MNLIKKTMIAILITLMIIFVHTNISKAATVKITTETLNLREEASTDSDIVALLSEGDECELLEEEGDWYRVQYGDNTGYISKEYAEVISDDTNSSNNTTDESNTDKNNDTNTDTDNSENNTTTNETDQSVSTGEGTINGNIELKIAPLINSSVLENVESGTSVTVITQINGWAYIYTEESAGWIRSEMVTVEGQAQQNNNSDSETTENNEDNNNEEENTNTNNTDFEERTMYINDSFVNIRSEASTDSDIIMVVEQNTALNVIGEEGDWYIVNTSEGDAYVSKDLLSDERQSVTDRGTREESNNEAEAKEASTSNSVKADKVVSYAKKYLGVPYVYGGASSSGFDCSGFTMYVYEEFGISMPHGATAQSKLGKKVTANKSSKSSLLNNLEKGDLVFFLDYQTMDGIGHCGIYIGDGNFIHASSGSGYCVKIDSLLPGEYYNTRYCAARRII